VAEIAVGAPVLGELDASALQLIGEALELGFEPLEQSEGVSRGPGEAGDYIAVADAAHFLGIALDDGLAEGDLAVASDHHLAVLADSEDGRGMPDVGRGWTHCCTAISAWRGLSSSALSLPLKGGGPGWGSKDALNRIRLPPADPAKAGSPPSPLQGRD